MVAKVVCHSAASATVRYTDLHAESESDSGADSIIWQEEAEAQHRQGV